MRKLVQSLLIVALLLSITGCGGTATPTSEPPPPPLSPSPTPPPTESQVAVFSDPPASSEEIESEGASGDTGEDADAAFISEPGVAKELTIGNIMLEYDGAYQLVVNESGSTYTVVFEENRAMLSILHVDISDNDSELYKDAICTSYKNLFLEIFDSVSNRQDVTVDVAGYSAETVTGTGKKNNKFSVFTVAAFRDDDFCYSFSYNLIVDSVERDYFDEFSNIMESIKVVK